MKFLLKKVKMNLSFQLIELILALIEPFQIILHQVGKNKEKKLVLI